MKTLIILAHPGIQNSVINKRLLQEALKEPQRFSVHDLTQVYGGRKYRRRARARAHQGPRRPRFAVSASQLLLPSDFKIVDRRSDDARLCLRTRLGRHSGSQGGSSRDRGHQKRATTARKDAIILACARFLRRLSLRLNTIFTPITATFSHFTAPRRPRAWTTYQARTI